MDNQKKTELRSNFTNWQNSIIPQLLDCPKLLHIFTNLNSHSIVKNFNYIFRPIIETKSEIKLEKLIEIKHSLESLIENKLTTSSISNKKLFYEN